ncbi:MAG TPA: hypothetical protein VGJ91_00055 [Polyangiaceae bacterium]|jgi:hypothetical protein
MIAVALSPKARALIQAHRDERPTAEDRERVTAALRARLGVAVLPLDAPVNPRLTINGMQRWIAATCGLCVVGTGLFLSQRSATTLESPTRTPDHYLEAAVPAAIPMPTPSRPSEALETTSTPAEKIAPVAAQRARPKPALAAPAQDTLAQELLLLTSAASQLSTGQAAGALRALDEHQRRFSHGVLSNERNVAKARALCMLHRFDDGRAALALIGNGTPAAARAKEECDVAWARANAANLSRKSESD